MITRIKMSNSNFTHRYFFKLLVISLFLVGCDIPNSTQESSVSNYNDSNNSTVSNNDVEKKTFTNIIDEYNHVIKNDSDYTNLKNLADNQPNSIKSYAENYCKAKAEGISEDEISRYLDGQAEKVSKSFSDSDTAKRLLIKAQNYSIKVGKKYYCE